MILPTPETGVARQSALASIARAAAIAVFGAGFGGLALLGTHRWQPGIVLEMDRDTGRTLSGVYEAERHRDLTFAWTSGRADLVLPRLDRSVPWRCELRYRGARPDGLEQPVVRIAVDQVPVAAATATNEFQSLEVDVPARSGRDGLALTIASAPVFVPGPEDARKLGLQLDRLACDPAGPSRPPRRALAMAATAAAIFGATCAIVGLNMWAAALLAAVLATALSVPLATGVSLYAGHPLVVVKLTAWASASMVLLTAAAGWRGGRTLTHAARLAIAVSTLFLTAKLAMLLHPDKPIVDAVFHAHRLEWVLDGRYYFTQPMPDGVRFPYAIALYVFAAPWSALTTDFVALLRIVVSAAEALAGLLLYPMIVRVWNDRHRAVLAVALFHLVPVPYEVIGNANLTNAFGQSIALGAAAAATLLPGGLNRIAAVAVLTLITAAAFLSHVSTIAVLAATLFAAAGLYWTIGGRPLHAHALAAVFATIAAAAISVAIYYAHPTFRDAYAQVGRVRGTAAASSTAGPGAEPATAQASPLAVRIGNALALTLRHLGWPLVLLAAAGAIELGRRSRRDRLSLMIVAWAAAYTAFLIFGVMAPVGIRFERYAIEFVGRVTFATYPAAVILAAGGALSMWRIGGVMRIVPAVLLAASAVIAGWQWLGWLS